MSKKIVLTTIVFLFVLAPAILGRDLVSAETQYPRLTERESKTVTLVNGTRAYDYDLELEEIALDHGNSGYSFRSAGSPGANQTAEWIKSQFEIFGLDTRLESFEFTNWYLPSQPSLVIDQDGNASTTDDQAVIGSFQSAHYSWPTPEGGVSSDLVILPLPEGLTLSAFRYGSISTYTNVHWNDINTTGKIVLVGSEVNWYSSFRKNLETKLDVQPPAALIYTYWYDWMSFTPPMYGSMAGRSLWGQRLPTGWINYQDGLWIRNEASANTFATVKIPSIIENGTNYNVVAKLKGAANPEKAIIISGHYDTVMDAGFCDNGAGTAGVIELARIFTDAVRTGVYVPEQTLIFVAFTGEELGFIGSTNYIKQHKAEIKSISAVINLDCIGQGNLTVSLTFPDDNGLELDQIVLKAAEDLGVRTEPEPENPGGSDQEAFRNPILAATYSIQEWGVDPGINDAPRVKSSTMLSSTPLFYSDQWQRGRTGWAHTEYDNSTSTATLNWVTAQDLEAHIKVATLSVMRFLAALYSPFMLEVTVGAAITSIILAVVVIRERSKVWAAMGKIYDNISYYIEPREMVFVVIIAAFLIFSSYAASTQVARVEVVEKGISTVTSKRFFGYPFHMIALSAPSSATGTNIDVVVSQLMASPEETTPVILWIGLLFNVILFFLMAFGITYLGARLKDAYSSWRTPAI